MLSSLWREGFEERPVDLGGAVYQTFTPAPKQPSSSRVNSHIPKRQHSTGEQTGFSSSSLCKGPVVKDAQASLELNQGTRDESWV